ncbi:MAG: glycosyltransferase family 4 protein [Verrucomicrobiales bacterium]
MRPHFAYIFERFPSFTQTFCAREVLEIERQGMRPLLFSIRDTRDESPRHFSDDLYERVHFLPPEKELIDWVKRAKQAQELPQEIVLSLRHWGDRPDKMRVYEAAYIGHQLRAAGVRHVHSHFAGLGARVSWWLRQAWDCAYSFTGHANDLWCAEAGVDVTLGRLMADASLIVTVSDFTAQDLRQRFPGASGRIRRVYNGLDLSRFATAAGRTENAPLSEDPPLIFSVGRLIEKKGYPDLIDACARLKTAGVPFRCEIAGDGPLEESLRDQIALLQLHRDVYLIGPTPQDVIIQKLGQTRVFALACAMEKDGGMDNLPTVLMEAMAAAVPCVSTRLAGVPEMVDHEETGLLVNQRDPAGMAGALARLLNDPRLARRMGQAGRERAQRLFSKDVTTRQLMRYLVGGGLVNFDPALARRHPELWPAYSRQGLSRLARLTRCRGLRHRRPPDFLQGTP